MNGMSSGVIAQMVGAFAGTMQVLGIGGRQYGAGNTGMQAEGLMGSGMSRGMSTGGSMMGGAASMLGLDPMGLGMRAGMGAFSMSGGGLMSAGMAGMGVFGAASAGVMGAGFAGQQVMQGASNTMGLNNALRQNFNFQTANGQGFSRGDMTAIGGTLQSMTHQVGAGGEMAGFGELSRLASNMGKMGMTSGVRDAQEFSKKFKEMVSTLKTVATELGTSLESAQELLSSSRGSGIFKKADQLKFSGTIRNLGLAGGLATSELTAMGNIGSQISRQFGGLGRQGAFGGMKALGQVGTATKIGALSEEDIYNATGQTGAEGRQAMATEMMQHTGSFLRSGKGRWFMASMAGKDGKLDMNVVNEYMSGGGFNVGETRDRAHQNLNGIGRANFIRNEGRLRGAIMEQMGGLAPALALTQWAAGKNINIDDMDPKSMLFAQKHLGMGRDELDATIKMAQSLPEIMRKQRDTAKDDEYNQGKAQFRKSRDVKVRLDQIREKVQGKLQEIGSSIFTEGSDFIETTMNRMLGQYETHVSRNLDEIARSGTLGGAANTKNFKMMFGDQAGMMGMSSKEVAAATAKFQDATGGIASDPSKRQEAARLQQLAHNANFGGASQDVLQYAEYHKDELAAAYNQGGIGAKRGEGRTAAMREYLTAEAAKGDPGAQRALAQLETSPEAVVGAMERKMGLDKDAQLGQTFDKGQKYAGEGGHLSESERQKNTGRAFTGVSRNDSIARESTWGGTKALVDLTDIGANLATAGALAYDQVAWAMGISNKTISKGADDAGKFGDSVAESGYGTAENFSTAGKLNKSIGRAFEDEDTKSILQGIATGEGTTAGNLRMAALSAKEKPTEEDTGQLTALKMVSFGKRYADLQGNTVGIKALLEEAGKDPSLVAAQGEGGITAETLERYKTMAAGQAGDQAQKNAEALTRKWSDSAMKDLSYGESAGILSRDLGGQLTLSDKSMKDLSKMKDPATGAQAAKMGLEIMKQQSDLGAITDPAERAKALEAIAAKSGSMNETISNMSVEDMRKMAASQTGLAAGDQAQDAIGRQTRYESVKKSTKGDVGQTMAKYMGLKVDDDELKAIKGKSPEELQAYFSKKLDLDPANKDQQRDLKNTIASASGATGGASTALRMSQLTGSLNDKQKEKLQGGAKDPQVEMAKDTARSAKFLEAIAKGGPEQTRILAEMAAAEKAKNPDAPHN